MLVYVPSKTRETVNLMTASKPATFSYIFHSNVKKNMHSLLHRVSEKGAFLFLLELCQISNQF